MWIGICPQAKIATQLSTLNNGPGYHHSPAGALYGLGTPNIHIIEHNQIGENTMQINLTGHHMDITPAIRSYVEGKFRRLERHFDHMTNVQVILSIEKERQKAEARIEVNRGTLFADSEHEDMYAAIDTLMDKLDRQIIKHKEKLKNHHRNEASPKSGESA